ncbi:uncharacterized protein LOC136085623 [Hydra vulgaris]|uniref:Uncharacterized protein LOC136085623 n=1 Tax=Hydra vulgaris TaxID=6087 RepID=A0ABM4CMJ7_HYDVU
MERTNIKTGETIITTAPFRTNNQVVLETTDLDEFYEISKQKILESLSLYQQAGSDKIDFPVSLNQITQFEKNNTDISVNVYGYKDSEIHILHVSKNNDRKHLIDLLLISNGETNYYLYADFESFIKQIDTCEPNPNESYTKQYQKHIPSSFCCYIKCFDESINQSSPVTFTLTNETDDAAQIFVDSLEKDIKKIYGMIKFSKKIFTDENKHDFNAAISCHICGEKLNEDKERDHCHITGKYRGAAHQNCNLNYKIPKFFPELFHNLSGYDFHLFIKKLSGGKLSCKPNNEEKYISFSRDLKVGEYIKDGKNVEVKRELYFLDSYRFMSDSLDALSKNLSKDKCKNIGKLYSGKKLDLLLRKGVYPYDWDVESKFDTSEFDPKHPAINNVDFKVGVNKKVRGMFKDESEGAQIEEFVGLRSKLYSYKVHGKDNKKCKGVKENVVKKCITHEDYKDCLLNKRAY